MKQILKGVEPDAFSTWKDEDTMSHRPRWNRVPAEIRKFIHQALIQEQGFICCYCESMVMLENSHVEHFRPKENYQDRQLEYENLLCSCQRELAVGEPRHCGYKKGSWFDENLLISPLDANCEQKFLFTGGGEVFPRSEGERAAEATIQKLGLNLPKLQALRSAAIDALYDLPREEIIRLLEKTSEGRYPNYCSAISQVLLGR
ncbi:MAG: TIGR02646 family protein [Nitrospinae bacterium]|nr:TIGR02646 family protein [Nitrospinota bacterium]